MDRRLYVRHFRSLTRSLPRRAYLTIRYRGVGELAARVRNAPGRFRPRAVLAAGSGRGPDRVLVARNWYREHGRPVTVVIPSYGPAALARAAAESVRRTTDPSLVRIVVPDDGSSADDVRDLRRAGEEVGFEVVAGDAQRGFAANCNRGIRAAEPESDVVLLNSDVEAYRGWLEALQHTAYAASFGVVGGRLLYPDGTIQFGGIIRNPEDPEWFDHRYRFRPVDHAPAGVTGASLAATGACMYITRETLDLVGELDEEYPMAFEDIDFSLRVWSAGGRVGYAPAATLVHQESKTRGLSQGDREKFSQQRFWEIWGSWFDRRNVVAAETPAPEDASAVLFDDPEAVPNVGLDAGPVAAPPPTSGAATDEAAPDALRIIYVTQDTGIGGGHRVIFTHLNGLAERGHRPELWTLADAGPDWFDLDVPVRTFSDYPSLARALAPIDAIKVATWWETAPWVWEASVARGIPVYLVQDIETSYYRDPIDHGPVLDTYRFEFEVLSGSEWVAEDLRNMGLRHVRAFTPGLDLGTYHPLDGLQRSDDAILSVARSAPIKNFDLTRDAYTSLSQPRPPLWLFGIESDLVEGLGDNVTFHKYPSDEEVNELYNRAAILLQTSRHEGFCLPALEGMAGGAAVVCTDAHGNRDFCRDGYNCLLPKSDPRSVAEALRAVGSSPDLRRRLVARGYETAQSYAWPKRLDELDRFYRDLAAERASGAMRRRGGRRYFGGW